MAEQGPDSAVGGPTWETSQRSCFMPCHGAPMSNRPVLFLLVAGVLLSSAAGYAQDALIIDHTCTDLSQVPDCWIDIAKNEFRLI